MLVYVALYMSRAFWQRSFGALYRGATKDFAVSLAIPGRDSRQIVVCGGVFCCLVVTKVCP